MKTLLNILLALSIAVSPALADAKVKAGPRKGRVLEMEAKIFWKFWTKPSLTAKQA